MESGVTSFYWTGIDEYTCLECFLRVGLMIIEPGNILQAMEFYGFRNYTAELLSSETGTRTLKI